MERVTGLSRVFGALLGLLLAAAVGWSATPAYAAGRTVVIQDGANGPVLVPASLSVAPGDTVSFLNNSSYPLGYAVSVTFGSKVEFSESVGFGAASSGHWTAPATAGVRTVTATQQVTGTAAKGSITVVVGTSPSPSVSSTSRPSTSPRPAPSGSKPVVAPPASTSPPRPTAAPLPSVSLGPLPTATATVPPPGAGTSPVLAGTPAPSAAPLVVSGPLEPPTRRAHGLPAALAAALVGGTGAAYVRVLLAEPVDDGPGSVGRHR